MTATKRKNINPRIERKITRISSVREVKQTFLIICEGVNTEPDYFNAFRLTSANVKALGQGMGTLALVHKAIHIKEQEKLKGRTYNQMCIRDRIILYFFMCLLIPIYQCKSTPCVQ